MSANETFRFICSSCSYRARIPSKYDGVNIKCPGCAAPQVAKRQFDEAPASGDTVTIRRVESNDPTNQPTPLPVAPPDKFRFVCTACGYRARIPVKYQGMAIKCPSCGVPQMAGDAEASGSLPGSGDTQIISKVDAAAAAAGLDLGLPPAARAPAPAPAPAIPTSSASDRLDLDDPLPPPLPSATPNRDDEVLDLDAPLAGGTDEDLLDLSDGPPPALHDTVPTESLKTPLPEPITPAKALHFDPFAEARAAEDAPPADADDLLADLRRDSNRLKAVTPAKPASKAAQATRPAPSKSAGSKPAAAKPTRTATDSGEVSARPAAAAPPSPTRPPASSPVPAVPVSALARRLPLIAGILGALLLIMIGLSIWMHLGWKESAEQFFREQRAHEDTRGELKREGDLHLSTKQTLRTEQDAHVATNAILDEERTAHAATRKEVVDMTALRDAETAAKEAETRLRETTQATLEATQATLQTTRGELTAALGEVGQLKQQLNDLTFELERLKTQAAERGRAIMPGTR